MSNSIDIQEIVIRGADILDEGKFNFDRSKYLNGSEGGGCIRRQWYDKHEPELGAEQDWGFARRGSHGEKFLIEALVAANVPLAYAGKEQVSWQDEKRKISSTPDGIIQYDDEWIVPEFKTLDPRVNRANLPRLKDVTQIGIAMEMIDQFVDRPDGVVFERGLLIYMDASNYYDIEVYEVLRDYQILDRMAKRASKILRSQSPDNLDREGKTNGGRECRTCPFKDPCGVTLEDGRASSRKKANRGSKLDGAAIRYMDIKDEEERLKLERDVLKEDIIDGLKDRDAMKIMVGNIEVNLAAVNGRTSLDKKAVAAAGIDLSPFEKTGASSERLTLKRI